MTPDFRFPEWREGGPTPETADPASLSEAVLDALDRSGITWLRRVVVVTSGGSVILRGTVPSFYLKQLALTTVRAVPGVEVVRNELQVGGDG